MFTLQGVIYTFFTIQQLPIHVLMIYCQCNQFKHKLVDSKRNNHSCILNEKTFVMYKSTQTTPVRGILYSRKQQDSTCDEGLVVYGVVTCEYNYSSHHD